MIKKIKIFFLFLFITLPLISGQKKVIIGAPNIGEIKFPYYNINQQELIYNCFSRIISEDSNGSIIADLSYRWTINDRHTKYTFFIRNNIYFHDGSKLTVKDIRDSIEYSIKNYLNILNPNIREIKGIKEFIENKTRHIEGIKINDDKIIFILKKPTYDFLNSFTDLDLSIFKIKEGKFIGTGAYIPVSIEFNKKRIQKIIFKKNKKYFIKGLKSPDIIELVRSDYYKDIKEYDIISFSNKKFIKKEYLKYFNVYEFFSNRLEFLLFNLNSYWGKNKNFRKFLNYSFNYKRYLQKYNIIRKEQKNIIPYGFAFFKDVKQFPRYDKEKLKYFLSKIKKRDKPVKILTTDTLNRKELAEEIKKTLEKYGFKVILNIESYKSFLNKIDKLVVNYEKTDFDIAPIMFSLVSPPFTVTRFFYSMFFPGAENYTGTYDNKKIQKLIMELRNTIERSKKIEIINKILKIHNEDIPFIPLYSSVDYYLVKKNIKKFSVHISMFIDYRDIQL